MTAPAGLPHFRGADVPPPSGGRRRLPVAADIALAVGLLVLDVVLAVGAFLLGIDVSGDWQPFDPGADNSDVVLTIDWLYLGIAGGLVLLTAALPYLLRAFVSISTQVLVGVVVLIVAVSGARYDQERGARDDVAVAVAYR
ncbi:hypothetical protein ACM01_36235 [Streptomyces viridochromogenes]|uniref:DUF6234 domain-containing protein n=1 Tax=Streptomyces viridochromogenes TaxID=1938 RepID=A0A0J8BUA1_STRVR|nr:DUF6234 family protein [Streptomyces viridochromogenes]KMS69165.1 hypothetical protein ACM01_36235 [Streptomyces viridochromogenes]KOG15398.1 hypothetical protein ADK36_29415 [Streptomyces viridochromogenes]KOG23720.1 hypothetical protein ADK35_12640 [Streptomyces viridochromogenes]